MVYYYHKKTFRCKSCHYYFCPFQSFTTTPRPSSIMTNNNTLDLCWHILVWDSNTSHRTALVLFEWDSSTSHRTALVLFGDPYTSHRTAVQLLVLVQHQS